MQHRIATGLIALMASLAPAVVSAQSIGPSSDAREICSSAHDASVGVAFGSILSMEPNLGVRPFEWVVSVRRGLSTHAVIEPEIGHWSFTRNSTFPQGHLAESVGWTFVGANLLARVPVRTAAFFAGGGAGLYYTSTERVGTMGGSPYSYTHSGTGAGVQVVAGVDVPVSGNFVAFGLFRAQAVPAADLGTTGLHAGIRYAF